MTEAQNFYLKTPGRDYALLRKNVSFMEELSLIENIQTSAKLMSMFPEQGFNKYNELISFLEQYRSTYGEYFLINEDWLRKYQEKYEAKPNQQISMF